MLIYREIEEIQLEPGVVVDDVEGKTAFKRLYALAV